MTSQVTLRDICQPSMSALAQKHRPQPLAIGLPNRQVISNALLFEYTIIFYLLVDTQLSTKSHLIYIRYKLSTSFFFISKLYIISNFIYKLFGIIYKQIIICKGYNTSYKQGPTTSFHSYKYQVPSNPQHISNTHTHLIIYPCIHILFLILLTHVLT